MREVDVSKLSRSMVAVISVLLASTVVLGKTASLPNTGPDRQRPKDRKAGTTDSLTRADRFGFTAEPILEAKHRHSKARAPQREAPIGKPDALQNLAAAVIPRGEGGGAGGNACTGCNVGTIECESSVTGNLGGGDCTIDDGTLIEAWSFAIEATSQVVIELTSVDFDTYLFLVDFDCNVILFNDDCAPGDFDLSCVTATLNTGDYFLVANTFAAGESGDYDLSITCAEGKIGELCSGDCTIDSVACSETRSDELADGDCTLAADGSFMDMYELTLAEDRNISIELASTAFDPYVWVYDENCVPLEANDDCTAGDLTLSCLNINLTAGTWFIGVNSFAPDEVGAYDLSITECGEPVNPCDDCVGGSIECDAPIDGELTAEDCLLDDGSFFDIWQFELNEDAAVTFEMTSKPIDTYLTLLAENCVDVIAANDDCGPDNFDLSCIAVDLTAGTYFVVAGSYAADEVGTYSLNITSESCEPAIPVCAECTVGNIDCNSPVLGTLGTTTCTLDGKGSVDYWQLDLIDTRTVIINHQSTVFDSVLSVVDSECRIIGGNDDCDPGTLNSCIQLELNPGTYYIGAGSLFEGENGEYRLTVDCGGFGDQPNIRAGDCNQNGTVDLGDAVCLFGFLFLGGDTNRLPCDGGGLDNVDNVALLDWNGDDGANLSDGVGLLNYLFLGGAPHTLGADSCVTLLTCPEVEACGF